MRAFRSVVGQNWENYELIVVDDRSTDNTRALVSEYQQLNHRVRYLANERSQGPAGARNFGLDHARGDYIAFLDSDDYWLEGHLVNGVGFLEQNPSIGFLFGDRITEDAVTGEQVRFLSLFPILEHLEFEALGGEFRIIRQKLLDVLIEMNFITIPASIIRTSILNDMRFDESLTLAEDRDFCIRFELEREGTFAIRLVPCIVVSRHPGNISDSRPDVDLQYLKARVRILKKIVDRPELTEKQRGHINDLIHSQFREMPYRLRQMGQYREALRTMRAHSDSFPVKTRLIETGKTLCHVFKRLY